MRDDEALVTVAVFDTHMEATLARGALAAIGIRALVPEEHFFRNAGLSGRLQVFEGDRDRAVTELRRMQIRVVPSPSGDD